MDTEKYTKSVALLCPTCGNRDLAQSEDENSPEARIFCPACNRTMTKDELIHENGENIETAVNEVKDEVLKDVEKELRSMLKNAFKGSGNIRIG